MSKKEIRKVLMDHYFEALKYETINDHCAGFDTDLKTYRGNSEKVVDDGLENYKKRLESKPPWLKIHEPSHIVDEDDIKITIDPSNPKLASATIMLNEQPPWFDVFSLRKKSGSWKIFKVRWIPEGGAPP
jgi:hypothetical protein